MTRRQSFLCLDKSWTNSSSTPDRFYSNTQIARLGGRIGVHPGIVIGQLQNRKELPYTHFHRHLAKIRHIITEVALTDGWGSAPTKQA